MKKELSGLDSYTIKWIPRERNTTADRLSKDALEPKNRTPERANEKTAEGTGIQCPKCSSSCTFGWQTFKNGTRHIRQICPKCGFIRWAPREEPFTSLAKEK